MATTAEIVTAYGDARNETDEGKRRELLELAWADDGTYTDPLSDVRGRDALIAHIGGFQTERMPGAEIIPTSSTDEHHGRVRFTWRMEASDGSTNMEGIDFGVLADDGRLARIVGLFGDPPEGS